MNPDLNFNTKNIQNDSKYNPHAVFSSKFALVYTSKKNHLLIVFIYISTKNIGRSFILFKTLKILNKKCTQSIYTFLIYIYIYDINNQTSILEYKMQLGKYRILYLHTKTVQHVHTIYVYIIKYRSVHRAED